MSEPIIFVSKVSESNREDFQGVVSYLEQQEIINKFYEQMEIQEQVENEFLEVANNNFWDLLENQND